MANEDAFAPAPRRFDQCDDSCTVDCGHCKGQGRPDPAAPAPSLVAHDVPIEAVPMGWRCRRGRHNVDIRSANLSGAQSYRSGRCTRCGLPMQQTLSWGGRPDGPWLHDYRPPCTHGVDGANLGRHNCMRCGNEHTARGLRW